MVSAAVNWNAAVYMQTKIRTHTRAVNKQATIYICVRCVCIYSVTSIKIESVPLKNQEVKNAKKMHDSFVGWLHYIVWFAGWLVRKTSCSEWFFLLQVVGCFLIQQQHVKCACTTTSINYALTSRMASHWLHLKVVWTRKNHQLQLYQRQQQ